MVIQKSLDILVSLGANIDHINGSLIDHLKGTYLLLKSWEANEELYIAGLYHALYGTSGFNNHLISHNDRTEAKAILGEKSEQIVYTYCACERDFFWPQIGANADPIFLNRFINKQYSLTFEELQQFCELTVANELEIAQSNSDFVKKNGFSLRNLFNRMSPYISLYAISYKEKILGK
ncbi:DUF6817 domain-containing protein [Legionella sp. CNM-1927-20]|uniref:DUF6817 domain-containing protein n=1 Tax=Legionella sp. CNM-1927-20 TaxID=3422221 RepID=UPI00403B383D